MKKSGSQMQKGIIWQCAGWIIDYEYANADVLFLIVTYNLLVKDSKHDYPSHSLKKWTLKLEKKMRIIH